MPQGPLPTQGSLSDPDVQTPEYQAFIQDVLNYLLEVQSELAALSKQEFGEAAVRSMGQGSGLNADLLDGIEGSGYLKKSDPVTEAGWYKEATVELGGDFDSGESVKVTKVGNIVTITSGGILLHASDNIATSSSGAIPSWAHPSGTAYNVYTAEADILGQVSVSNSGTLTTKYHDFDAGSISTQSNTWRPINITYNL